MEFFAYHRDRPGSATLRGEMLEQHWSYMDRFQDRMIARGPTLTPDGETATGSVHIVDLPSPADALLQAPDPAAARAVLPPDGYAAIEVHHWASGGRPG
jgi:uncharacterized protein YciI